jgi:hypothetical protein
MYILRLTKLLTVQGRCVTEERLWKKSLRKTKKAYLCVANVMVKDVKMGTTGKGGRGRGKKWGGGGDWIDQ